VKMLLEERFENVDGHGFPPSRHNEFNRANCFSRIADSR
jgi:hypothetical protein